MHKRSAGFTAVEVLLAIVVFAFIVAGLTDAATSVRKSYTTAKQLNEMYAVLSSCPELDRALDYANLTGSTNCFPNNTFNAEGGSGLNYTYTPTLSITDTSTLDAADPLKAVPDSKVVHISVGYLKNPAAPPLELKMLVSRNGIAQQ